MALVLFTYLLYSTNSVLPQAILLWRRQVLSYRSESPGPSFSVTHNMWSPASFWSRTRWLEIRIFGCTPSLPTRPNWLNQVTNSCPIHSILQMWRLLLLFFLKLSLARPKFKSNGKFIAATELTLLTSREPFFYTAYRSAESMCQKLKRNYIPKFFPNTRFSFLNKVLIGPTSYLIKLPIIITINRIIHAFL